MALFGKETKISGFSAMEVLVAMSMIGGVFGILFHFGKLNANRVSAESRQTCEQIARSTLDHLRAYGLDRGQAIVNYQQNTIAFPNSARTNTYVPWEDTWDFYPAQSTQLISSPQPTAPTIYVSQGYHATIGIMNLLAKLYNENSGYCSNAIGLPYDGSANGGTVVLSTTPPQTGPRDRFFNSNTTLRIQPYNLNTGQMGCPPASGIPAQIFPIPASEGSTTPVLQSIRYPLFVTADYGFWVTVTTTYVEKPPASVGNSNRNNGGVCSVSALFQYPKKLTDTSTGATVNFAYGANGPSRCQTTPPSGTLTISLPPEAPSRGWTVMCQDQSSSTSFTGQVCPGKIPVQPFTPSAQWVPCDQVTLCGMTATQPPQWNPAGTTLTLQYPTLLWGCVPGLGVRIIDQALNIVDGGDHTLTLPSTHPGWIDGPSCNFRPCAFGGGGYYCGSAPPCNPAPNNNPSNPPCFNCNDGGDGQDGNSGGRGADGCDGGGF